jgi:dTDP-4-amino-4,6-dideoxygalactose transaminase
VLIGPHARFRTYTRPRAYVRLLRDLTPGVAASPRDLAALETAIAEWAGVGQALCLPQARVGVYLAVKGLIRAGQTVVLSPYTIADVVNMVVCAGGVPVFADIDRPTTNMSVAEVDRLVHTSTGAVIVTHLHGMAADIERITAICRERGVPLIEDCAQAFGARVGDRRVGSFGDAGVFSFGMYKNITGLYGGMLVTSSESLHKQALDELQTWPHMPATRLMAKVADAAITDVATHPALFGSAVYPLFRYGYLHDVRWINKMVTVELDTRPKTSLPEAYRRRMRPAQARMILAELPNVDRHAETRIGYARTYQDGLSDLPDLIVAPFRDDGSFVYNYFPIQYRHRGELVGSLMRQGRDVAVQHLKNCASLPGFENYAGNCPNADRTANETILLPNYPRYGENEVRRNVDAIRSFFRQTRGTAAPPAELASSDRQTSSVGSPGTSPP